MSQEQNRSYELGSLELPLTEQNQNELRPAVLAQFKDQAKNSRVFVVEDDQELRTVLDRILRAIDPDVEIDWAMSAEEASNRMEYRMKLSPEAPYDLIVADIFLEGDATGLDLWHRCAQLMPSVPLVVTSGMPVDKFFSALRKYSKNLGGPQVSPPYLPKPFSVGECKSMFEAMLNYSQSQNKREPNTVIKIKRKKDREMH